MRYSPRFGDYVRDAGFFLELLEPALSDADADALIAVDQGRGLRPPFTTAMVRQQVDSELALIRSWQPDAIVIGTTLSIFLSARIAGVPLAYVKPFPLSRGHLANVRELPLFVGNGTVAKAGNRAAGALARFLTPRIRWKPSSFSRVAREKGLDLSGPTLALMASDADLIASLFPLIDSRPLAAGETAVDRCTAAATRRCPSPSARSRREAAPASMSGWGPPAMQGWLIVCSANWETWTST